MVKHSTASWLASCVLVASASLSWDTAGASDLDTGAGSSRANPGSAGASPGGSATGGAAGSAGLAQGAGSARIIQLPVEVGTPEVNAAASPTVVRLGARFTL